MSLKNNKPNPLNYFNIRKVNFPATYFEYLIINKYHPIMTKKLDTWISQNLNGRYYIGKGIGLDNTNSIVYNTKLGFEDKKELSYFVLTCPHVQNT